MKPIAKRRAGSPQPLSSFFAEFCESDTHFDSLLSKIKTNQKSKIAEKMGVFLRRPWTLSLKFKIELASSPTEFWAQDFVRLKKSQPLHELLAALWKSGDELPTEGTVDDFPSEMVEGWTREWGQEIAQTMARLLSQDPLTIIRCSRHAKVDLLLQQLTGPKPRPGYYSPRALVFKGYASVQKTDAFQKGWFEIQDEGSQLMSAFALADGVAAPALKPHPSTERSRFEMKSLESALASLPPQTVVDACAGSGGKTLALSDWLRGQGRVFAYDIYPRKILALRKRVERAGERNVQAIALDEAKRAKLAEFAGTVDRILMDSPCSGWGVLRRNPDIKWPRKPRPQKPGGGAERPITEVQRDVLRQYLPLLRPGGLAVYGVCTFQKAESTEQVEWILREFPELRLRHSGFIGPHETDGFFMASFEKQS